MKIRLTILLATLAIGAVHAQRAPYPELRYAASGPEVLHEKRWCRLVSIDSIAVTKILEHCKERHGGLWRKRFAEDLVRIMGEMGQAPGRTVDLGLIDLKTGETLTAKKVPMTSENRRSVKATWEGKRRRPKPKPVRRDDDSRRVSPFRGMRESGGKLEVQVDDDTWFEWLKLDGVSSAAIKTSAKKNFGGRWWKRITEDLVDVLDLMDQDIGLRVDLELRDLATGRVVEKKSVRVTKEKRSRLWNTNQNKDQIAEAASAVRGPLDAKARDADLRQLATLLEENFSYRHLRKVDVGAAIRRASAGFGRGAVAPKAFALAVDAVIAEFGDGHAGVRGSGSLLRPGYSPFLLEEAKDGVVAFLPDRSRFVDAKHPYVHSIDGTPLDAWIDAAKRLVNRGSPQYERRGALRVLRAIQHVRGMLGLATSESIAVTLTDRRGRRVTRKLRVAGRRPIYGEWPRGSDRVLPGNVGYLRIASMSSDADFLQGIDAAMQSFRKTKGLIVDVRGNGGGSRAALRHLFPYLMSEGDAPRVANVAAYRLRKGQDDPHLSRGYLGNRYLYPANWTGWSDDARTAFVAIAKSFRPEWKLPRGDFSGWHYMVLEKEANPSAYSYQKPVIVLMNSDCFSATDIFLGALKGWRGVTLMGTPSGGGSGRSQTYQLRNSGVRLRLSTMASFQPTGRLYEGNGIQVDIVVKPQPTDFLGQSDSVLEAAVRRLR